MHYFLLGPSGVGKTTFGDWLQNNRQYHHLAVDRGDEPNGLTAEGLIELWNKVLQAPAPFATKLQDRAETEGKKGCVLTFPSVTFFAPGWVDHLAKHSMAVRYLYGPKESCIEAFVSREKRPGRDRTFWSAVNGNYEAMGSSQLAPYRANIIRSSGERLTGSEIAKLLKIE
jgi:hypothetical protein